MHLSGQAARSCLTAEEVRTGSMAVNGLLRRAEHLPISRFPARFVQLWPVFLPNSFRGTIKAFPAAVPCLEAGLLAAVSAATSVAAVRVVVAIAGFASGAAAPPAVFLLHWRSVAPAAGAAVPAAVEACLVPVAASRIASPAAAGTSGPVSGCQYSEHWAASWEEGHEDGRACWFEQRYSRDAEPAHSPDAEPAHFPARDFHHDWPAGCKRLPPPWPAPHGP